MTQYSRKSRMYLRKIRPKEHKLTPYFCTKLQRPQRMVHQLKHGVSDIDWLIDWCISRKMNTCHEVINRKNEIKYAKIISFAHSVHSAWFKKRCRLRGKSRRWCQSGHNVVGHWLGSSRNRFGQIESTSCIYERQIEDHWKHYVDTKIGALTENWSQTINRNMFMERQNKTKTPAGWSGIMNTVFQFHDTFRGRCSALCNFFVCLFLFALLFLLLL